MMRLAALALVFTAAAPAWAEEKPFTRQDYETYFTAGRFAAYSPFYQSNGVTQVISNTVAQPGGSYVLEQTTKTLDVSVNYDARSAYKYYKVMSEITNRYVWSDRLGAYAYDYSARDYDSDASKVWESHNTNIEVTADDRGGGDLHRFYHNVDKRAGLDADKTDREFRDGVIGRWVWRCAYVHDGKFEVKCTASRQGGGRVETFFYRRLDLVS